MSNAFLPSRNKLLDEYYSNSYTLVQSCGIEGYSQNLIHAKLEKDFANQGYFPTTVEMGAGNYKHLSFVQHKFDRYLAFDIRTDLLTQSIAPEKAYFLNADAGAVPLKSDSVDRILSACLLLHVNSPWDTLIEWRRILKTNGVLDVALVIEGSHLLGLYREVFSKKKAKKSGVDNFDLINHLDHRNRFESVIYFIERIFYDRRVELDFYPTRVKVHSLNAFVICRVR
jgi:SAM-dependent methyltransferase